MSSNRFSLQTEHSLADFTLDVEINLSLEGITALFGPSGAGKSTLLNILAGFIHPRTGRLQYRDKIWFDRSTYRWTPPSRRGIGFLFQDARLFPHMSVHKNLLYAERRCDGLKHPYRFEDIIGATGIEHLLARMPQTLSGGETQKTALARTLLTRPDLLLLDEPLSALDREAKTELLPLLESLPQKFGIPAIYVSHDVDEVSRLAQHTLLMEAGRIVGSGTTDRMLSRFGVQTGRNAYERASLLEGIVETHNRETGLTGFRIGEARLWLPMDPSLQTGQKASARIPARDVAIALNHPSGISIQNIIPTQIISISPSGSDAFCDIDLDVFGQSLIARITHKAAASLSLVEGMPVFALIKSAGFQR